MVLLKELRKSGGRVALQVRVNPADPEMVKNSFIQCLLSHACVLYEGIIVTWKMSYVGPGPHLL